MTGLFIVVHALICIMLIGIILVQSGRGGGLTDGLAAAESVFGAKTNEFMVKATAIAGVGFLITSLSLAHLSSRAERSIMSDQVAEEIPVDMPLENIDLELGLPDKVTSPETEPIEDYNPPVKAEQSVE